ncbi:MAG: DNA mismatch repair protein MutS [Rhodospirillaceae bacterium]|nr:DNA mismatch repair protein MutS [Rhodospirillaceae bacterium]
MADRGEGRKNRRKLTQGELELWRLATRFDKPLPGRETDVSAPEIAKPEPPRTETAIVPPVSTPTKPPPKPVTLPPLAKGNAPGLDKRSAQRLRRGRYEVDDRIDLHGMTQDRAHAALNAFINASYSRGHRCVLVITGKGGLGPSGEGGVLRRSVPRWLNEAPVRASVLAFQPAQPRDGGEGALYVLLRRRRN